MGRTSAWLVSLVALPVLATPAQAQQLNLRTDDDTVWQQGETEPAFGLSSRPRGCEGQLMEREADTRLVITGRFYFGRVAPGQSQRPNSLDARVDHGISDGTCNLRRTPLVTYTLTLPPARRGFGE